MAKPCGHLLYEIHCAKCNLWLWDAEWRKKREAEGFFCEAPDHIPEGVRIYNPAETAMIREGNAAEDAPPPAEAEDVTGDEADAQLAELYAKYEADVAAVKQGCKGCGRADKLLRLKTQYLRDRAKLKGTSDPTDTVNNRLNS